MVPVVATLLYNTFSIRPHGARGLVRRVPPAPGVYHRHQACTTGTRRVPPAPGVYHRHQADPAESVQDFVQNNPVLSHVDDLSIMQLFREPLLLYLLWARDDITPCCMLIRTIRNMTAATVDLPDELLEQYCTVIEGNLNQEPWGSSRRG
jgi:hypothetical protein